MDQNFNSGQNDFLWRLLANPADDAHLYAFDLQRLVNDFPQSGILQALLAHANDDKNLKQASAYFNPRALFKLINAPATFVGVSGEKIVAHNGTAADTWQRAEQTVHEDSPLSDQPGAAPEEVSNDRAESSAGDALTTTQTQEPVEHQHGEAEHAPEASQAETQHIHHFTETLPQAGESTTADEPAAAEVIESAAITAETSPREAESTYPAAEEEEVPKTDFGLHIEEPPVPPQELGLAEHQGPSPDELPPGEEEKSFESGQPADIEAPADKTQQQPIAESRAADTPEPPLVPETIAIPEQEASVATETTEGKPQDHPAEQPVSETESPATEAEEPESPVEQGVSVDEAPEIHPEPATAVAPIPVAEPEKYIPDEEEVYEEITGIDDVKLSNTGYEKTDTVAEEQLIKENIAAADYFMFDKAFGEHKQPEPLINGQPAPAEAANAAAADNQDVSKYHDEKMPYTFMWWLDKTRREHSGTYQPYIKPPQVIISKPKRAADELQQQYYENIFHITSVEELDKHTPPPVAPYNIKRKEQVIIDRFIKEEPQIKPQSSDKLDNENKAKKSSEDRDELVTETLAGIYSEQMLYHKAIASYKKLMLKFPEKSRYFAAKIEQLEKKTN